MVNCGDGDTVSGFIDRKPYFRVHDWWQYAKSFLRGRYKDKPQHLAEIERKYRSRASPELLRSNSRVTPSTVPNQTVPNQTVPEEKKKTVLGELQNVRLTTEECGKLLIKLGEERMADLITELDLYIGSKGTKYKSHYATLLAWSRKPRRVFNGAPKGGEPTGLDALAALRAEEGR